MKYIKITQVRSINGDSHRHRATARSLGLRRRGHSVVHTESAQIKGRIESIRHLVAVESVSEKPKSEKTTTANAGYKVTKVKKSA